VHVGAPKTGTSYVQDLLFTEREALAAEGILYPGDRFDAHFLAALDLLELSWGGLERQAVGAWDRLAEQVRAWPGTAIISHEILATATARQARRALESLADPDDPGGCEIHLVLTARDLVRQIPAEWQENVKHRRVISFGDFLDTVTDPAREGALASWFWGVQEVPDILRRWGSTLPAEHVHLVTVPPPGAPRDLLWQRFAQVLGLDTDRYRPSGARANPSLGVPETALIRALNTRLNNGVLANEDYRHFVRELLAHRTLSQRRGSARLTLPPRVREWAEQLSETWVEELAGHGYDVVGGLDELRPVASAELQAAPYADPDAPDQSEVADAALEATTTLLLESTRLQHEVHHLRDELERVHQELEASRGLWFRAKRRLVLAADDHRLVAAGLRAYRRLRARSSRPA
jgi:hypothetical protein